MRPLTDGPVFRRLASLWLPAIGGVVSVKAIDLSDAFFVGQLGGGALAAISFTFPLLMTLISLAVGLSAGASSVLSRAIGAGAGRDERQAIASGAVVMAFIVSLAVGVTGWFATVPVLTLLGAQGEILADAATYLRIWFGGIFLLIVPVAITGLLRAAGHGTSPAALMALTAVLNIALNPVFIFGLGPVPRMEMPGAGVATLLARAVALVAALHMLRARGLLDLTPSTVAAGLARWREVARVGLPASLSTSLNPIAMTVITAAAATLGANAVAAFGLASKIQAFAVVPLLALSTASSPMVGQNSGGHRIDRSRRTLRLCALVSLGWSLLIAAALLAGARPLLSLFTDASEVIERAAVYLTIVPLSFAGYGITISLSAAMNGLGRSAAALAIAGGRAVVLLAPAAWLGISLAGFTGLAAGVVFANVVAGLAALWISTAHPLTVRGHRDRRACAPPTIHGARRAAPTASAGERL
jgi:putative MATE family efflux protein